MNYTDTNVFTNSFKPRYKNYNVT